MLMISPAVMVTGVAGAYCPNDYILFPDSADKNLYYALAERPCFQVDGEGNPNFNLTWYFGSGTTAGGICTMTVALPVPDMNRQEVREKIAAALTKDATTIVVAQSTFDLCAAIDAGDAAKVAALKTKLGLDDAAANGKKAVWLKDHGWEQFLPAIESLDIRPIPFKSGTVTVQAFSNTNAYQQGSPEFSTGKLQTIPSLVNSNAAVVTFNLQELGANLFWHGLGGWAFDTNTPRPAGYDEAKGGSSIIAVTYKVEFDGLLPQASATVTLSREVMAKLKVEDQVRNGSWGRTYREQKVTGKEYNDAVNNATEIVLPAVATKDDKDNVQKLLTDWAAKQLEEMVASQMPAVKLEDLSLDGARQMSTISKQSRTYKLTQAVTVPKLPQSQLPKIDKIVKQGTSLKNFFQLINLNDKPYFNVDLTVSPPSTSYLKARQVERFVVTQLAYCADKLRGTDGKEVSTIEYVADGEQKPSATLSGTFQKSIADKSMEYSYLVAYKDGTPPYRASSIKQSGTDYYLDLSGLDIGVLSVTLNGIDLPWDVISSAKVDLKYGDWQQSAIIHKDDKPVMVVKPFGEAMTKPLTYRVTLTLTAGAPYVGEEIQVALVRGAADITLKNPLGDTIYNIGFDMSGVTKAQLRVAYTMKSGGADRVFNQMIQLDSAKSETTQAAWKVPGFGAFPSSFRVLKARVTADGAPIDLQNLNGGVVDPVQQDTQITVMKDGISTF